MNDAASPFACTRTVLSESIMAVDARAILAAAEAKKAERRPTIAVDKEDDLTYDLGHLYAFDPSPV